MFFVVSDKTRLVFGPACSLMFFVVSDKTRLVFGPACY